jgi:cation transport ATPase
MKKKKHKKKQLVYAAYGLIISLIFLALTIIAYYSTVTITLLGPKFSFLFTIFMFLYSWPFLIVAFLGNLVGLPVDNQFLLVLVSTGTYTLIGYYIGKKR